MGTHTTNLVREIVQAAGYSMSRWPIMGVEIAILLEQRMDTAMGLYTQHYRAATAGMPAVYQNIIRIDYMEKAEEALGKINGKIALFRAMQALTPARGAQKEPGKAPHAISFVNDIPGMFAGGITHPVRDPIPNLTQEEVQADHHFFKQCRNCGTPAPTFDQESQQQVLDAISKIALTADESFGRSKHILIIGVTQWTGEDGKDSNDSNTRKMLEHIIARMGYQNESQHYDAMKYNGLSPKLQHPAYEHILDRDDSKVGMMLIELEMPVLFSCTSTLQEDDRPGIVGEIQKIYLRGEFSPAKRNATATVYMQMLPFIRPTEIREDETTPLIGCLKGLPAGINASALGGACMHAVRKWLSETMHFDADKYTLLLDAHWKYPGRSPKGQ